jgi:hypothetical protein
MPRLFTARLALVICASLAPGALPAQVLTNAHLRAQFGERGLVALGGTADRTPHTFARDAFRLTLGGQVIDSRALPAPARRREDGRLTYTWTAGAQRIEVTYELRPEWKFLSKELRVIAGPSGAFRVDDVVLVAAALAEAPISTFVPKSARADLQTGDYGGAMRFAGARGLLAVAQNPFLRFVQAADSFSLGYAPAMEWQADYGPFVADRALIAPYRLTDRRIPSQMRREWQLAPNDAPAGMDEAEIEAFTGMVRAFLLAPPPAPLNVFVGWCVNDYQIDTGTPEGRAEYRRVIDNAADLGAQYVLFAPQNSAVSRREESVDDWSWEHALWLGLGQRLRKGEWDPRTGEIPSSVQEMLDYAKSRNLRMLAYVYPVVPFSQNAEWLVPGRAPNRRNASLGVRSLQDWLIETLVAFHRRTGIGGYAFDHTFLTYQGTSRYSQWWGWRRVMEELRRRVPDIVIDGRQAYHLYGPWSWLAGSYPHPTFHDEQPESFVPFPDLHFDRVSAARQRWTAYRYRNFEFAPSEIMPGFITHQTPRLDDTGEMPSQRTDRGVIISPYRTRDWDVLGWKYSLLSSIATGGWNNVLNMIPARDTLEARHFSAADREWFRGWLRWTDTNKEFLRNTRTILDEPGIGRVDGTSAIVGDRGYLFLFNSGARRLVAGVPLDSSIGLGGAGPYVVRELYPRDGRALGKPGTGPWSRGDRLTFEMDGGSAVVLALGPTTVAPVRGGRGSRPAPLDPVLFNVTGSVRLDGGVLRIAGARGVGGRTEEVIVTVAPQQPVATVFVNDVELPFVRPVPNVITVKVPFAGTDFGQLHPLWTYDSTFIGGTVRATVRVPRSVVEQLVARRRAWPLPWTPEDYRTTWLASERLLLFVQLAEPDDRWDVRLRIDGKQVELRKAYSAIRVVPQTFVGFYADLSLLEPDREYVLEMEFPRLKPGQLQGLFFENVETTYTEAVRR